MTARRTWAAFFVGTFVAALGTYVLATNFEAGPFEPAALTTADATSDACSATAPLVATPEAGPRLDAPRATALRAVDTIVRLEHERHALLAEIAALEAQIEHLTAPADPNAFRFGVPELAPDFDRTEWDHFAESVATLTKILPEYQASVVARGRATAALFLRFTRHRAPLAGLSMRMREALDEPQINGGYTHPVVVANLIRAALQGADLPLSHDQRTALEALGRAYVAERRRVLATLATDAPALAATVLDVEERLRFQEGVKRVLDDRQRAVVFDPRTEGRLMVDPLSPALLYVARRRVDGAGRAAMAEALVRSLFDAAGVTSTDPASLAWAGRAWVEASEVRSGPVDPLDLAFPRVEQLQREARAQVAATGRILASVELEEAEAGRLRGLRLLLAPVLREDARPSTGGE